MTDPHVPAATDAADLFLRQHGDRLYSARRVVKSEHVKPCLERLKMLIDANASQAKYDRKAWLVLKGIKRDVIAERLLAAGILIAASTDLGVDGNGEQNYRDARLWLGRQLVEEDETESEFDVGDWGIDRLIELPIFDVDWHGIPTFSRTDELGDLTAWIGWAIATNAFMLPRTEDLPPWIDVTRRYGWAVVALVKRGKARDAFRRAIKTGKMWLVLEALTALEAVRFTVNEPILEIARQMAPANIPAPPEWLAELQARQERIPQWRIAGSKKARDHIKACCKLSSYNLDMTMAEMLVGQRFVVPLHLDTRGRVYASTFFNFQRGDSVRGLFQFADPAPITEEGIKWLKAHIAGRADSKTEKPSKLDFGGRVAWAERNEQHIRDVSNAVRCGAVPAGIDGIEEPIQYVAACHELAQALDVGPSFETRLPLTFDCSCSGLQHISMMTRDETGARYSNLIPSDAAQDFYADVARQADQFLDGHRYLVRVIERDAAKLDEPNEWLRPILTATAALPPWQVADELNKRGVAAPKGWRSGMVKGLRDRLGIKTTVETFATKTEADCFAARQHNSDVVERVYIGAKINRAIAKEPVVAYFYAATRKSMIKSVAKFLEDSDLPTTGDYQIADAIHRAVEHVVPQAKEVRLFLQRLAKLYARAGKLMHWPTPFGLPVINLADEPKTKRKSKTRRGVRRQTKVAIGNTGEIDEHAAARSVTANYTHAMDAATLHLIVYLMTGLRIGIVTVHDCFGALAPDAAQLNWTIRDALAVLYERFFPAPHDDRKFSFVALAPHLKEKLPEPVFRKFAALYENFSFTEPSVFHKMLITAAKDLPGVKLPEPPRWGAFDVGQVRHSHHACK